jgi:hypothetical protein
VIGRANGSVTGFPHFKITKCRAVLDTISGMTTPSDPTSALPQRKLILVPPPLKNPDDLLNAREVGQMLGVDVSWVKNHSTRLLPFIPSVKWGDGPRSPRRYRRVDIFALYRRTRADQPEKKLSNN